MDDLGLASRWVLESSGHVILFIAVINIVEAYSFLRDPNLGGWDCNVNLGPTLSECASSCEYKLHVNFLCSVGMKLLLLPSGPHW